MGTRPTILLVEDDDFAAEFVEGLLSADYLVHRFANGRSALSAFSTTSPDLVLLDVSMPGLSGYDVCRLLRGDSTLGNLPIIFLSGMVSEKERLAGYEAGGDDYLTKPVAAGELRSKIHLAINHRVERQRLKSDISNAFTTAMTAMTSAAELGAVVQFLRKSISCLDYVSLCQEILTTVSSYGLEASVQIRGKHRTVSRTANGPCSPLEESVLSNLSTQGHIFEFGLCTSYNFDQITIITKNKPNDDADHHGRMKDNLAILAEAATSRVATLDDQISWTQQQDIFKQLISNSKTNLPDIEQQRLMKQQQFHALFEGFCSELERLCFKLGFNEIQLEMAQLIQKTSTHAFAFYDERLAAEENLESQLKKINHVMTTNSNPIRNANN